MARSLATASLQQFGTQIGQDELCPLLAQRLSKSKTQAAGSAGHKDPAPSGADRWKAWC